MEQLEIIERIQELEREIALLPPGSIAVKKVRGKEYYYHRITRNQKRTETYIDFDRVDELRTQIERRKELEEELKRLKRLIPSREHTKEENAHQFSTYVRLVSVIPSCTILCLVSSRTRFSSSTA